jgi:ABC-type sugar transport system substrate-binding protein
MKRFLPIFLSMILASCAGSDDYQYNIGVSQCSSDDWRNKMNKEMHREAMLSHEVAIEIRSAGDNNQIQCDDIRYFIDKGVDLLVVSPNEADAVTPAVEEAFDAGIPVIVVDRNVNGEKYTAFIGADNEQVGYLQSQYVRSNLKPGQKIIEIKGLTGSTPSIERHNGFIKGLEGSGIEILASVDARWRTDVAQEMTDSLIREQWRFLHMCAPRTVQCRYFLTI